MAVHHSVLMLDFQQRILLKLLSVDGSVALLWLQGRIADQKWLALRRAIVATNLRTPPQNEDHLAPEGDCL